MAQPTQSTQPTEYNRGEMSVDEHLSMYHRFNGLVHWGSLILATGLSFFVLLLCVHAGFLPSLIVAVIIASGGTFWLTRPKAYHAAPNLTASPGGAPDHSAPSRRP